MEKHIPPELYRTVNSAKKPFLPSTLTAEAILTLQEENEGGLHWTGVSPEDVGRWERNHPEGIEHDEIRQEYNFLNGRFMIKCAPTPTHESFSEFFIDTLFGRLKELAGRDSGKMVRIGSGRGFSDFRVKDDYCGKSKKIRDAYVIPPDADFPAVVCEIGWSEKHAALEEDARLWLLYTDRQTRLVIIVEFTEHDTNSSPKMGQAGKGPSAGNGMPDLESEKQEVPKDQRRAHSDRRRGETEKLGAGDDVPEMLSEELDVESKGLEVDNGLLEQVDEEPGKGGDGPGDYSEEKMVVDSIDGTTSFRDLTARLLDLNRQGKLRKPLVGDLRATLYIYKANKDRCEIEESFKATLLPPPTNDSEAKAPTGFGISFEDLLGGDVPDNHDPEDVVWFSFENLQMFITSSLPYTEKDRAIERAAKLLEEAGEWEERETWAQGKRRRLNKQLV